MNCFISSIRQFYLKSFFLFTFFLLVVNFCFSQADGEKIFKQNCAACHRIDGQKLVGPGLKDVASRVPQPADEWLFKWIKNNVALQKAGDAYANKVFNDNAKLPMLVFEGVLSDDAIKSVIAYMKNPPAPASNVTAAAQNAALVTPQQNTGESTPYILFIVSVVLIMIVIILGVVLRNLQTVANAKKGLPPLARLGVVKWASNHKRLLALIGILCLVLIAGATYQALMEIGVYQTYKPVQPILFSHQTHAGKLTINCVYCHSDAEKGKTAGVPSANVCMNCHKAISSGPLTGKVEIAKIYDAVGWNIETGKYDKPQHPIEWVRVHALADFAYFNHSQHVVVGKQACANCHGDMAATDVALQNSPLTMGWCIDCHRKTEVPGMTSNPYYADLHKKLAEKYKGQSITVEKMGGLDCIKCHY
ncbi:MAG: c-type cytochrome [Bacteroidetes bacterium]|nr:c-type cytochrome [Bacteroidota bacterium]